MIKVLESTIGEFKGTVYLYSLGYGYKIKYKKNLVDQSCVYFAQKQTAIDKMTSSLKELSGYNKSLFDLERMI